MRHAISSAAIILATIVSATVPAAETVTVGSLVGEMIDMHRLAEFPDPAYETVQFSSYDHRSVLPGGPDWFANSDGFGREPVPNFEAVLVKPDAKGIGEYLVCDVQGPGAVVRVWTAAISGSIRMYLDGADDPVYDGPAEEFFMHPYRRYAEAAGLDAGLFSGTFQQRNACYFPIPFAKGCRIVWTGNVREIHFYQIQIRRYAPGAEVKTFRPEDLKTYASEIRRVAEVLSNPKEKWPYKASGVAAEINATVPPNKTAEIASIKGPKSIERLKLKIAAPDLDRALRQTVLRISFDDYPWGQVQAPIGDFFGAAPGINPYDSVPFTVEPDGTMTTRYMMPFAKSCRVFVDNHGAQSVKVEGSVAAVPHKWNDERSMHFRARWRVDHDLVAEGGNGVQDLPFLLADGSGRYVGTAVMLLNPNPVPWPGGNWWGEGDEKVFVDDDRRPSTFGTGSEDYFNYAWSTPDIFGFPYCGQPRDDGPANRGFVTNHRWHILDSLPFQERIAFYMELFSHERTPDMSYARIAYHYGRPGLIDDHVLITKEDVRHLELPANWQPAARGGAANAVFYQAEDVVQEGPKTTLAEGHLWSGGKLMVWHPGKQGEQLTFKLPVSEKGRYVLRLTAARTPEAGRFSATLDGKKIGFGGNAGVVDLHVPYRTLLRNTSANPVEIDKGDHALTLQYEGSAEGAAGTIGIDFIWVQKR